MISRTDKSLFIMLLLIATGAAFASPTVPTDNAVIPDVLIVADTSIVATTGIDASRPIDSKLAEIGRELQTPPAAVGTSSAASAGLLYRVSYVESLPAVPRALLMALTGFLCVSLVKDRKVWLTALCGLLWVGQTGIQVLPQFAERFSHTNHCKQQQCSELAFSSYFANSLRLRCDIEGTRYIGLLHHLAGIPDVARTSANPESSRFSRQCQALSGYALSRPHKNTDSSSFVSLPQYLLYSRFGCLVSQAGHFIVFSPAFTPNLIPRGPPQSTLMSFHTVGV